MLAEVPRPCYGLLLVFPVNEGYEAARIKEDQNLEEYNGCGPEEEVIWFRQTIGTGCGMVALLHCLANGEIPSLIKPQSDLAHLFETILPLQPIQRANALCDSVALEVANESAATEGSSEVLEPNTPMDLHFVCFMKSQKNNLWELDGRRKGPLNRGSLEDQGDALSERALKLGVRAFLEREKKHGGDDLRFSLISLGPKPVDQ